MVDEMMTRLDEFVRSEEAFASTELPKEEASELEIALESGKLNHLIKDVRQRGQGNTKGRDAGKNKIINMIRSWPDDKKRKSVERGESWMKAPIVFPPLSMEDTSDEPLIIEAIMEGVKSPPSIFLNNTLHGKVPHTKRDRNYGHPDRDHIRVLEAGKKANGQDGGQSKYPTRGRRSRKSGPDRANTGQPIISGPASDDKGKPLGRDPGGDQRSGRMGEHGNSPPDEIPYMDIKPGACEERQRKLENVHRL
ncbi:hypothetical protein Tco_0929309 [Tanacetum coccineum]